MFRQAQQDTSALTVTLSLSKGKSRPKKPIKFLKPYRLKLPIYFQTLCLDRHSMDYTLQPLADHFES